MAGSMKDIKLRIKSVESTMQITKAMELVASSKMRRAKERVEHSRPYFETLHKTLTEIAAADPRARNPYLRRAEIKKTLLIVIAGDRGLAGGYNSNVLRQAQQEAGDVVVLPIGKRSAEYFVHHEVPLFTQEVLLAADITVGECFQLARRITEGYCKGEYDAVKICYTRFDSMMTQTASTMEVLPLSIEPTEQQKAEARRSQILYKPSSEEVFRAIIPEYVAGIVYGTVIVGEQFQHQHTPFDNLIVTGILFGAVGPVEPVDQRAAVLDFFAFDVDRNNFLVVRQQQEFVLFEPDLLAVSYGLQRKRGV